ncbi:electron transporter SenC [Halorubrum sp. E3]|uniref:Electron transporter SenC n=1 Tax=Halorubrum persicum TaxID=1383844 RepID=A0A2G1WJJ5_9EURY|nr:SCO family protein [Halorubrum persicum]OYR78993.1 electron transporter SenC [Halorubrum sp. E3]PHQ39152.1 electron transporter SenC [Halorubrum persicum]
MDRRRFCSSVGALGATIGTAGCMGTLGSGGSEKTVLNPPDQDLSEAAHPSYGDEMPAFTAPDPITDETVSIEEHEGEQAVVWTSFYTNCPDGVCPALILRLRRAQEAAAEDGYGDDVSFLALTFDPERDTAAVLREYANQQGVNLDAGNWHFLRPDSYERGQELLDENFGLLIEKAPADQYDNLEYQFPHYGLILLANKQGIVERAYPRGPKTDIEQLVEDVKRVATA